MITINKWNEVFENADTRKRQRLGWLGVPTGCDSNGYLSLVAQEGGFEAFGIFLAICQWSATQPKNLRGKLVRSNGNPLTEKDIAVRIRAEVCQVVAALKLLKSNDVGWLKENNPKESADDLPMICQSHPEFVQGEGEGEGEGEVKGEGEDISPLRSESSDKPDPVKSIVDLIWEKAPEKGRRRSSKKQCIAALRSVKVVDRPGEEEALAAITAWSNCEDWKKDGGEFVPGLHRWIKDEKWRDLPGDEGTQDKWSNGQW